MSEKKPLRFPADWVRRKSEGQKISMLTAYDASMARLLARSSVDALLIGDSLSMVIQGNTSTLPVTLDEMIYHCRMVRRGAPDLFLLGDLPFGSYNISVEQGVESGIRMMKEGHVSAVKLEGATDEHLEIVRRLHAAGVPVMGHIGLMPQSYLNTGGFRVQGRDADAAVRLKEEAQKLQEAGSFALLMELVARDLTREISQALTIPTIGIGSGVDADGQVLVINDMLGMDPGFHPRHLKIYAEVGKLIEEAANSYQAKSTASPEDAQGRQSSSRHFCSVEMELLSYWRAASAGSRETSTGGSDGLSCMYIWSARSKPGLREISLEYSS